MQAAEILLDVLQLRRGADQVVLIVGKVVISTQPEGLRVRRRQIDGTATEDLVLAALETADAVTDTQIECGGQVLCELEGAGGQQFSVVLQRQRFMNTERGRIADVDAQLRCTTQEDRVESVNLLFQEGYRDSQPVVP